MRKICPALSVALLLAYAICCQNNAQVAELKEVKAQALVESKNKEIILKMYERLSNWQMKDYAEYFSEDARVYGVWGFLTRSSEPEGPSVAWSYFYQSHDHYPGFSRVIYEVIAEGNAVVVRLGNSGVEPDGILFRYGGVHTWHLRDGKIFEGWILDDSLEAVIHIRRGRGLDRTSSPWLWGKSPW